MEWTNDLVLRLETAVRDMCVDMLKRREPRGNWDRWLDENDVMTLGVEDVTFNWNSWPDRVLVRCPMDGHPMPERWLLLPDDFALKILCLVPS